MLSRHFNSDENVLGKVRQGDREAFGILVERYLPAVQTVAYAHCGNFADAEDIAQDAFLRAFQNLDSLRERHKFAAWLLTIARNGAHTLTKSRQREVMSREGLDAEKIAVLPDMERRELSETVHRHVMRLEERDREILLLRYYSGFRLREIAALLNISVNAVNKRLHRAKEVLGSRLLDEVEGELPRKKSSDKQIQRIMGMVGGVAVTWENAATGASLPTLGGTIGGAIIMKAKLWIGVTVIMLLAFGVYYGGAFRPDGSGTQDVAPPLSARGNDETQAAVVAQPRDAAPLRGVPDEAVADGLQTDARLASDDGEALGDGGDSSATASGDTEKKSSDTADRIEDPEDYAWVQGLVTDDEQSPIANAMVTVVAMGSALPEDREAARALTQAVMTNREHHWQTITGPDGRFLVEDIHYAGMAFVTARAREFRDASGGVVLERGDEGAYIELQLEPGTTFRGLLLSSDGEPVGDGQVQVTGMVTSNAAWGTSAGLPAFTDETGYFETGVIPEGLISLRSTSATYGAATFSSILIVQDKVVELRYPAPASLYGTVARFDGTPVEGVRVLAQGTVRTENRNSSGRITGSASSRGASYETTTDAEGSYQFAEVAPGQRYRFAVLDSDGEHQTDIPAIDALQPGEERRVDITVQDVITVTGIVRGTTTGQSLPGIMVTAIREDLSGNSIDAKTASDGRYALTITTEPGAYTIGTRYDRGGSTFGKTGAYAETIELAAGEIRTLDLELPEPATRSFRVVTEEGQPVEGLQVSVFERMVEGGALGYRLSMTTDTDGRLTWAGVPAGSSVTVRFDDDVHLQASSAEIIAAPGEVLPKEVVVMYERAGVSGTLIDAAGQILVEAEVELVALYGEEQERTLTFRTDAQGVFLIGEKLPATEVWISLQIEYDEDTPALEHETDWIRLESQSITDLGTVALGPAP